MELAFETKPLRETCESEATAKRELGSKVAKELKRLLADLRAASSIEEMPVDKPRKTSGTCVFDLTENCRLIVAPNHTNNPLLASGSVDWAKVARIKILRIELRHG